MGKLNSQQVEEYFAKHLPYRIIILLRHKTAPASWLRSDPGLFHATFIASIVTGRLLLEILGVGLNQKTNTLKRYKAQGDDVNVEDLGGELVNIESLTPEESKLMEGFILMAHKGAVHFTTPKRHPLMSTIESINLIHQLLDDNLYKVVEREIPTL